jgi:hypothetical protein
MAKGMKAFDVGTHLDKNDPGMPRFLRLLHAKKKGKKVDPKEGSKKEEKGESSKKESKEAKVEKGNPDKMMKKLKGMVM